MVKDESVLPSLPKKTVCFVTLELYPTTVGGTGTLIAHMARALLEDEYDLVILFASGCQTQEQFLYADRFNFSNSGNIRAYHLDELVPKDLAIPTNLDDDVYRNSVKIALSLVELTQRHHVDIIELYDYCGPGFHAFACPELMTQTMVVRCHSTVELIARRVRQTVAPQRLLHFHQEREQLRLADGLLISGENFYTSEVKDIYPYLDDAAAYVSPPLLTGFEPHPPRANARNVLFYGRLSTLKGLDTFLRGIALALEDDAFAGWCDRILIAGAEETVATGLSVEEMVAVVPDQHRGRLNFLGLINHDDLQDLLPDVAFAVFANKLESFCYAAHELFVSGTPLILTELPTFKDFFVDGESAAFFNDTAIDLASKMQRLAADPALRERFSRAGIAAASSYLDHRYDDHLAVIKPRRTRQSADALSITILVFSTGVESAEARTIASLEGLGQRTIVLRLHDTMGWSIAGSHWRNDFDRPRGELDLAVLGDAVLGLRAGDVIDREWLDAARVAMASDPRLGVVAGWQLTLEGLRTSASNLLPELALGERMGLGRLIRIPPGLLFAELAGLMKQAGEVGLVLATRKAGLALVELPRIARDSRDAVVTPAFDGPSAMAAEADRLDPGLMAQLPLLARQFSAQPVFWRDVFTPCEATRLPMVLENGLCRVVARPDLAPGGVAILRAHAREGSLPIARSWFSFAGKRAAPSHDPLETAHLVPSRGSVTFPAADETTMELRQGPTEGICEVEYNGRTLILDLRSETLGRTTLRLGDFAILAPAQPISSQRNNHQLLRLEGRLAASDNIASLTIAYEDRWTARRAAPLGAAIISPQEILAHGVHVALETMKRWKSEGRFEALCVAIEDDAGFALLEHLVDSGFDNVTALLPSQVENFAREGGYSASVLAASALVTLAWRANERSVPFSIAAEDPTLAALISGTRSSFYRLSAPWPLPKWSSVTGSPTIAVIGRSNMAHVRTHLVSAAMMLRQRLGGDVRILIPANEPAGDDLLKQFQVLGIERFNEISSEIGMAAGPAVALAVYPDSLLMEDAINASALGYVPLMGPASFRWAVDTEMDTMAARFRVEYWDDAKAIANAAQAILADWSATIAAWEKLREVELDHLATTRAQIWGGAPEAARKG